MQKYLRHKLTIKYPAMRLQQKKQELYLTLECLEPRQECADRTYARWLDLHPYGPTPLEELQA